MKGWANWKAFMESTKMKTKCSDIEQLENLWQCVTEEDKTCKSPAFVICEGNAHIHTHVPNQGYSKVAAYHWKWKTEYFFQVITDCNSEEKHQMCVMGGWKGRKITAGILLNSQQNSKPLLMCGASKCSVVTQAFTLWLIMAYRWHVQVIQLIIIYKTTSLVQAASNEPSYCCGFRKKLLFFIMILFCHLYYFF